MQRDRHQVAERHHAGHRHQHVEDLLGGVGGRGDGVGGEDGQRDRLRHALVLVLAGGQRPPDDDALERVEHRADPAGLVGQNASHDVTDVVGQRQDGDVATEEQAALEEQRGLVVQQVLPPPVDHELGDDDRDAVVVPAIVQLVAGSAGSTR